MENLKQAAIKAISTLPENVDLEEIMYKLYVIDKVRKGENAIKEGKTVTSEELKKEMASW
jgi:predicted transcriptional regulator